MNRYNWRNVSQLFSATLVTQAVLSVANLAAGLLLIRYTSATQYGYYVLVTTVLLLATSSQRAYFNGPLSVIGPKLADPGRRDLVALLMRRQRLIVFPSAIALMGAALALAAAGRISAPVLWISAAFCAALPMALMREYLRQVLILYHRPGAVLYADLVYTAVFLAGTVAALWVLNATAALATASIGLASWAGYRLSCRGIPPELGHDTQPVPGDVDRSVRHLGRWSLAGSSLSWAYLNGYNYLLATIATAAAVADVAATRLMAMPVNLLLASLTGVLLPVASGWFVHGGIVALRRKLWIVAGLLLGLTLCYFAVLWPLRAWIAHEIMHQDFAQLDLLILLWGAVYVVTAVRTAAMTALQVLEHFDGLVYIGLIAAPAALIMSGVMIHRVGAAGAVSGVLLAELLHFAGILLLIARIVRRSRRQPDGAA